MRVGMATMAVTGPRTGLLRLCTGASWGREPIPGRSMGNDSRPLFAGIVLALCVLGAPASVGAQQPGGASARDAAPIDLTGYWVSYVTENWRYRMVTPAKGEYRRLPVSPGAVPVGKAW